MKRIALTCIALLLTIGVAWTAYGEGAFPPPKRLTTKHMMADFKHAYTMLLQHHPYFEHMERNDSHSWTEKYSYYLQLVKQSADEKQFGQVMQMMLKDFQDGETRMLSKEEYEEYDEHYDHCDNVQEVSDRDELDKMSAKRRYAYLPADEPAHHHMNQDHHYTNHMQGEEMDLQLFTLPHSGYVLRIPN